MCLSCIQGCTDFCKLRRIWFLERSNHRRLQPEHIELKSSGLRCHMAPNGFI